MDNLEHPERIALSRFYPAYHRHWAVRRAQHLLTRTDYASHHTVESLTELLLRARIEVDCSSDQCDRAVNERANNFFKGPWSVFYLHASAEQIRQTARKVMMDSCQGRIAPVCPVFFLAVEDRLVVLDEFQRVWINGRLAVQGVIQFKQHRTALLFLTAPGELYRYWHGSRDRCPIAGSDLVTHVSGDWLIQGSKIVPAPYGAVYLSPLRVILGERISLFLSIDNRELFIVQDETGCYLVHCSGTEELSRQRLPRLRQVLHINHTVYAQLEDDSLVKIRNCSQPGQVEMKQLDVKGKLVPVSALPLIIQEQGSYFRFNTGKCGIRLIRERYSVQLQAGPSFCLVVE